MMSNASPFTTQSDGHGDVFAPDLGAMIVHVQRESGLAHRTFVLQPWQVRILRTTARRSTRIILAIVLLSWGYLAFQAARVPLLTSRISRMEEDAVRLDTLQQTMKDLQARYDQVQAMLSRPAATAPSPKPGAGVPKIP